MSLTIRHLPALVLVLTAGIFSTTPVRGDEVAKLAPPPPPPPADQQMAVKAEQLGVTPDTVDTLATLFAGLGITGGLVIGGIAIVRLYVRLRARHPIVSAVNDAWVQARLRELEAASPEAGPAD